MYAPLASSPRLNTSRTPSFQSFRRLVLSKGLKSRDSDGDAQSLNSPIMSEGLNQIGTRKGQEGKRMSCELKNCGMCDAETENVMPLIKLDNALGGREEQKTKRQSKIFDFVRRPLSVLSMTSTQKSREYDTLPFTNVSMAERNGYEALAFDENFGDGGLAMTSPFASAEGTHSLHADNNANSNHLQDFSWGSDSLSLVQTKPMDQDSKPLPPLPHLPIEDRSSSHSTQAQPSTVVFEPFASTSPSFFTLPMPVSSTFGSDAPLIDFSTFSSSDLLALASRENVAGAVAETSFDGSDVQVQVTLYGQMNANFCSVLGDEE